MADMQIDYQAVVADLEARRAAFNQAIDNAIVSIRQILALSAGGVGIMAGEGAITPNQAAATLDENGFFGMNLVEAAKKLLRTARRKLSNKEIADALERGGYVHTSKDFMNTVGSILWRAVQNGDTEIFRQGRFWLLSEWAPGRRRAMALKGPIPAEGSEFEEVPPVEG